MTWPLVLVGILALGHLLDRMEPVNISWIVVGFGIGVFALFWYVASSLFPPYVMLIIGVTIAWAYNANFGTRRPPH